MYRLIEAQNVMVYVFIILEKETLWIETLFSYTLYVTVFHKHVLDHWQFYINNLR